MQIDQTDQFITVYYLECFLIISFALHKNLGHRKGRYYFQSHFTDGETEAQKSYP